VRLLTLATLRLPDLFLYAHIVEMLAGDADDNRVPLVAISAIGGTAAGAQAGTPSAGNARAGCRISGRCVGRPGT
jgi:hypothetical protein